MFKKLLGNLPFNPSLITQVSFYAKRLRKEAAMRRIGIVILALTMLVQLFAVISPPQSSLAASSNDIINGGFTTRDQAVQNCTSNSQNVATILNYYGVDCKILGSSATITIKSTDNNKSYDSLGRNAQGPTIARTGKPTNEYAVHINGVTYYMKNLWAWDSGASSSYKVLKMVNKYGQTILVMYDCGNIITSGQYTPPPPVAPTPPPVITRPTPPPPAPAPTPTPPPATPTATPTPPAPTPTPTPPAPTPAPAPAPTPPPPAPAPAPAPAPTPPPPAPAPRPASPAPAPTPTPPPVTPTVAPTPAPVQPVDQCANIPGYQATIQECDVCPNVPGQQSSQSECYPCPQAINDATATACMTFTKTASNDTQKIANANGTTAKNLDVITYTLAATNTGTTPIKDFVIRENLNDVLEYSDIVNLNGATLDQDQSASWAKITIGAGQTITKQITVKVKATLPLTPQPCAAAQTSATCPNSGSFDMIMTNVFYGKAINISLTAPPAKIIEQTAKVLPNTGPGTSLFIGFSVVVVAGYFFGRSSLFATELDHVREEFSNSGGI